MSPERDDVGVADRRDTPGMMRTAALLAIVAALLAVFAAPAGAHPKALRTTVTVAASEFKFILSKKTASRGVVVFKVTNVGATNHDFLISGRKTRMLKHGESDTLRVTFLRKGSYKYQCTVAGHAAAGMRGVFTIK
jgi:plastocyanin